MSENDTVDELTPPLRRACATAEIHHRMLEDPEYQHRRTRVESFARGARERIEGPIDIEVVVHIVMQDPATITDAQVRSQIDVLNEDFQVRNTDIGSVPAPFTSLVGNADIHFRLAITDPDGNPTTAITRTTTTVPIFGTDDQMMSSATGGHDPWDTTRYLNIWVTAIRSRRGNALLGYAHPPGGPANTDGVVITPTAFGRGGSARGEFDLGRTATHEVGHWLDLRHIWGDEIDCLGDDLVADTPRHREPNYDKPAFPRVTCGNEPAGELFMNYMDYVDDDSMFMFTKLQVERMRTTLSGPRLGVVTSRQRTTATSRARAMRDFGFTWD